MSHDMGDQVLVVTGGAGVIGREVCAQALAAGARVVLNGRDQGRCEAAAEALGAGADRLLAIAADISDPAECVRLVARAEAAFGKVTAVVHCAQGASPETAGRFASLDPQHFEKAVTQAVCRAMYVAHAALPALKRAGGGTIVAYPSDAGKVAAPNQTIVGATRAAVMMFMRSLALEASADGIRCNCIAPTYVDTPALQETIRSTAHGGRFATAIARAKLGLPTPQELAALTLFLCGPGGAHLTGQVISVNGGLHAA